MSCSIGISTWCLPRLALAMLFGLIGHTAMAQSIQGTATYRERIALPPGAVFEVTLEDVSRADAAASIIATTRVAKPGNPPIRFTLAYDPAKIVAANRYVIRARILLNDQLIFTTDTAQPVITRGSPTNVSILLRRVEANQTGSSTSPALAGTSWQLVKFQGGDEKILTPDDGAKYTIEFAAADQLTARIDCNR